MNRGHGHDRGWAGRFGYHSGSGRFGTIANWNWNNYATQHPRQAMDMNNQLHNYEYIPIQGHRAGQVFQIRNDGTLNTQHAQTNIGHKSSQNFGIMAHLKFKSTIAKWNQRKSYNYAVTESGGSHHFSHCRESFQKYESINTIEVQAESEKSIMVGKGQVFIPLAFVLFCKLKIRRILKQASSPLEFWLISSSWTLSRITIQHLAWAHVWFQTVAERKSFSLLK